ncbi:MAG: endonuclease III [Planctomycetales bacterium]|nr:endonuclease III [Planctomycetales bacterium]
MASSEAQQQAARVAAALAREYPGAECELEHENGFQLLIATILAAQCTDERVNQVTRPLFQKYPTPAQLGALKQEELEELLRPTGFFRNKAKSVKACCQALVRDHNGEVPEELDALVQLPGVGRKTANLVLGVAYGIPTGVVVDTHVLRLSKRLGLADEKNADKAEQTLNQLLPQSEWIDFSHRLILHGRRVCKAKKPLCDNCSLHAICPRVGVEPAN